MRWLTAGFGAALIPSLLQLKQVPCVEILQAPGWHEGLVLKEASVQTTEDESITLRPKRGGIIGMACFFIAFPTLILVFRIACAFRRDSLFMPLPTWSDFPDFSLMFLMFAIIPICFIVWSYIAFVRLDPDGMCWREGRQTLSCKWSDVSDYYCSEVKSRAVVLTPAGTLSLGANLWQLDIFKNYVRLHAQSALPKDWREIGTRPDIDWPLHISYDMLKKRSQTLSNKNYSWIPGTVFAGMLVYMPFWQYAKDGPTVFPIDLAADSFIWAIFLFFLWLNWWAAPEDKARQNERITVNIEGLTFEKGQSTIRATWMEIRTLNPKGLTKRRARIGYYYSVEAPNGLISFSDQIDRVSTLKRIIGQQLDKANDIESTQDARLTSDLW